MKEEYPTWAQQRWWQDKCNAQAKRIEELEAVINDPQALHLHCLRTMSTEQLRHLAGDETNRIFALNKDLVAILQRAVNEAPDCSCIDDYKKRGRIDPTCVRCNHFAPWIDDAKKALDGKR